MGCFSILRDPSASRNWADLPRDVMVLIVQRMCCYDVLTNVKLVCKPWHSLCKDPFTWRVVEIRFDVLLAKFKNNKAAISYQDSLNVFKMIMHVFDSSRGQMLDLTIFSFPAGDLLAYVSQRSSRLRSVRQHHYDLYISTEYSVQILKNIPLLEELQLSNSCKFSAEHIEIIARCCPHLKSLALNDLRAYDNPPHPNCNEQAFAIAKNIPQLCRLRLYGNSMTNEGLSAILNNCHHLEYLDIRHCYNIFVVLEPELMRKARKQIKYVRFSKSKTRVYQFDDPIYKTV